MWIDPWVRKCWYAIIDDDLRILDAGILLQQEKWKDRAKYIKHMCTMQTTLAELYDTYKPKVIWLEKLFFSDKNQANAEFVFWLRWAVLMDLYRKDIVYIEVSPTNLKRAITWRWTANKILVQRMVQQIFWLTQSPAFDDAADALWLAYLARQHAHKNNRP